MRVFVVLICLLVAAPTAAQSTSIGVTANWDIARFSRVDIDDEVSIASSPESLDGEALGFGVSVRRGIGRNWGVAFEFSRTGEIESRSSRRISPLRTGGPTLIPTLPGVIQIPTLFPPLPDFEFVLDTEQQHQTFAALAWVRHDVSDRIDLSYTGGITFVRSEYDRDYSVTDPRLALFIAPLDLRTIDFSVGATAGLDVDVELTDHTGFTGAVRLQGLNAGRTGWLIRPAVGVRWTF
jgi:hypothetical protein